jgi:hypothetical protein
MIRLRNVVMAVALGTGVMGCALSQSHVAHYSIWHCDECDDFPTPAYGPGNTMMPGTYTGQVPRDRPEPNQPTNVTSDPGNVPPPQQPKISTPPPAGTPPTPAPTTPGPGAAGMSPADRAAGAAVATSSGIRAPFIPAGSQDTLPPPTGQP